MNYLESEINSKVFAQKVAFKGQSYSMRIFKFIKGTSTLCTMTLSSDDGG
jgi:hypothetical protein